MRECIMQYAKQMTWGMIVVMCSLIVSSQPSGSQTVLSRPGLPLAGFRANEVIVKIRDELPSLSRGMTINALNTESRNLNGLNAQFGVKNVKRVFQAQAGGRLLQQNSPLSNVLLLNLREDVDERTAMRAYNSLEEVEYAELNYWYYVFSVPNDAFFSSQYGLYNPSSQGIDAIGAWDIEVGNESVIIAIIDTGIDYTHEDLAGKVIKGYDFVNEDFDPKDDNGHGTHVAGIAGAFSNNRSGIAGVCPGCSLLAIKVITADGAGTNTWIANGIANAVNLGAQVINLSLGGLDRSHTIELAVQQAYQNNVLVVAASGNDGSSVPLYPAAFPEVIAVGATDRSGDRASFSSYGSHLELAAPGQAIYGTLPGNTYDAWNGTSMASPHVAGLAGLVLSKSPGLSNDQVRRVLVESAQDLGQSGRDASFGYGRINAYTALSQTPTDGSNYPAPTPNPGPYPSPEPGTPATCSESLGGLFVMAILGLGGVNIARWKQKK
ncbi:S8 family serine peptidase [candidate division KSB3 bacterium]|uniref:S8 family serine peptidase n=1 Tax=candidate division KSB3 bacterium TaxID=2044937 RepID=A0A9D5K0B3_9BACT|nr:S8 family serine peptidase [candidate division KSB3 bacterium]MBD3327445.1 S8 family serine peptidase [candidate division KSB3 bacterium]